ncbi:MAG TPA: hypothetical protein VEF04_09215 [Blastocatellia bacterium]|nr:hypothetical protein [Blastocatellia bacterium]
MASDMKRIPNPNKPITKNDMEQFAVNLTDNCKMHEEWLSVVRFGLKTLLENQPLLIEIIAREASRQLERKNLQSLVIADEVRFIFEELELKLVINEFSYR